MAGLDRRVDDGLPVFFGLAGELDEQDCVFCRKADEADLGQDVVVHVTKEYTNQGRQDGERDDQNDREGKDPALVLGGQRKEYEDHRQSEDEGPGAARVCLLVGKFGPFRCSPEEAPWPRSPPSS